jgi:hypothetical protein
MTEKSFWTSEQRLLTLNWTNNCSLRSQMRGIYSRHLNMPSSPLIVRERDFVDGRPRCLVRIRRWVANLPLPSVLLANVQSLDNKVDVHVYPTNRTLKTVISYVSPSRGWTMTWISFRLQVIHCIGRIEQQTLVRGGGQCIFVSNSRCMIPKKVSRFCSPEGEYLMIIFTTTNWCWHWYSISCIWT